MNQKKKLITVSVIAVLLAITLIMLKAKVDSTEIGSEVKNVIASASQLQLGSLDLDYNSIDIAKKIGKEWQKDAILTSMEITRIPGVRNNPNMQEQRQTSYWFLSPSNLNIAYSVVLNVDNSVKEKKELERNKDDFRSGVPLDIQKIKVSSSDAFNIVQKIATEFELPAYDNNYLSMGLMFNDATKSYQWLCATTRFPSASISDNKRVVVVINAETGEVNNKLIQEEGEKNKK
jgi:hypothetical protein